ncbi:phytanoyl-CoA dioxygenase family protein [Dictyobacter kobayashii]|uniref:Protein involved in biosynthesis of mitomycin antibiotics/polyketide fumonisin n=1 Tax=Dictyobacter kobayashii TaxID=2014872 RepID=A0A402ATZ0_9CHLR|nr:phytanoyl-CoA dioxygenase family protein [Dictyobacter kobayashii]GCE22493.1 protein involved in biosynthesis of mitomycin antibiotics/polyketide fumonisin [Dictyobacter kobayashii]
MIAKEVKQFFDENGYVVVKQLFSPEEVAAYRDHFMDLRLRGSYPGDLVGSDPTTNDPLKRYPRMIQMHHWDATSLQYLIDQRLNNVLTGLLGQEPYAVQTMLYFKPPMARGQALHQDNFFLRARPGTCMAAWMALDPCDEENGCMQVVPGSQKWPILCTTKADTKESFSDIQVPIPEQQAVRSVIMEPGDVLFFGGSLVHGSYPNTSHDRFRRALIGHYISGEADTVTQYMKPIYRMDGSTLDLNYSIEGGPCGVWVDSENGTPEIAMTGVLSSFGGTE